VVGKVFNKQDYAFLLPENSPLKETLDRTLLKFFENGTMDALNHTWFGSPTQQ
jgi:ABC-type amino acid transport substrate-binding protein